MTTNDTFQVWLQSPAPNGADGHFHSIAAQLQTSRIECNPCQMPPEGRNTILLLLNDQTTEEEEQECLKELLEPERHVIALYTGEKKLPFYRVWRLLSMGVDDVLDLRGKIRLADAVQSRLHRWSVIDRIVDSEQVQKTLLGSCPAWRKVLRQVVEIACFSTAPVLILGESGTGKELIARLIHDLDKRQDKQSLVLLDCTIIVPELSGSEFFGHEKGAFTNAVANRDGAFSLADRGTLFLDEIGELPLRLQAELLRVSQDGLYKRVGSNIWKKAQFRLVCATNRNLLQEVEKGDFRQDLYYRLSTCVVQLPPLRDRRLDIPELAEYFLAQALQTNTPPPFDPLMLNFLLTHPFPGNVRQLRQLITRIAYRHTGDGPVTIGDIPDADRDSLSFAPHGWQENGFKDAIRQAIADGVGLKDIKRIAADVAMDIAIEDAAGNLQEAARRLDVTDRLVQGYLAEKKTA
ncbi:MAG: sigma-54-dependent Fis family transcriptional regulator [Saprospiraceae bacterium]|nr:sigma-54-dependent Fis family transcriptional regulator [Saprospiraceae bacterium]